MAPAKLDGDGNLPCHAQTPDLRIACKNRFAHCFQQPGTRLSMKRHRASHNDASYLILFRRIRSSCSLCLRVSSFLSLMETIRSLQQGLSYLAIGVGGLLSGFEFVSCIILP